MSSSYGRHPPPLDNIGAEDVVAAPHYARHYPPSADEDEVVDVGAFTELVAEARTQWLPLRAAEVFLRRDAQAAADLIFQVLGPMGPPVTPEAGSLFVVDPQRVPGWRADGFPGAAGSPGGALCAATFLRETGADEPSALASVLIEWALVSGGADGGPPLQRRALRVPHGSTQPTSAAGQRALAGGDPPAPEVLLVQYLRDGAPPSYTMEGLPRAATAAWHPAREGSAAPSRTASPERAGGREGPAPVQL